MVEVMRFDPSTTLNVWIGELGGGLLGYSQLPGGSLELDGAVIDWRTVGDIDDEADENWVSFARFAKGRTLTHELGHYFNLEHVWGASERMGCDGDDGVADTPRQLGSSNGCPYVDANAELTNTCVNDDDINPAGIIWDMRNNYMDFSDDSCMNMFSEGQALRALALFAPGNFREAMGNNAALPLTTSNPSMATSQPTRMPSVIPTQLTLKPTLFPTITCLIRGTICTQNMQCCSGMCRKNGFCL